MDILYELLEEKKPLNSIDIRTYYLNDKEKKEWKKRNILYNTLWFYSEKGIDVEFSKDVWEYYKKQLINFKDWEITNHRKKWKYKLVPKGYDGYFSADIMTGWWNPFKQFIGLTGYGRENLSKLLFVKEIPQEDDEDKLLNWFVSININIQIEDLRAFLDFLKTVYTIGNIIPVPTNKFYGNNLDNWFGKLDYILNTKESSKEKDTGNVEKQWSKYISSCYYGDTYEKKIKSFIEDNCLTMYIENGKVKNPFKKDENTSYSDWTTYFKNATACINKRNEEIEKTPKGDE